MGDRKNNRIWKVITVHSLARQNLSRQEVGPSLLREVCRGQVGNGSHRVRAASVEFIIQALSANKDPGKPEHDVFWGALDGIPGRARR